MKQHPSVTCGFTLFNCEDTILRAINSGISQDYPDKQLLFVDDCSSDKTVEIVRSIMANLSIKSRLIRLDRNMGVAHSRNILIQNCVTDYLAFFDDDDQSHPQRLITQINHLESYKNQQCHHKTEALCFSNRFLIKTESSTVIKSMNIDLSITDSYLAICALLSANSLPKTCTSGSTATCTLCGKLSTFKEIGGFDKNFRRFEDLDLAVRALMHQISLTTVEKCLVNQFFTDTADKTDSYIYNLKLIEKYQAFFRTRREFDYAYLYVRLKNRFIHSSKDSIIEILCKIIVFHPLRFIKHALAHTIFKNN